MAQGNKRNSEKKIVIGNWKMNPLNSKIAQKWLETIAKTLPRTKNTEIVVCAPFLYLEKLSKVTKKVSLGAQDAYLNDVGPFTGEISTEMLYEAGARHVILGHSERRALGESDKLINKKLKSALASSLTPILCVGEKERDSGHEYLNVVKNQLAECLDGIQKAVFQKIIFAYEPVWAISSTADRRDATSLDSREMAMFIRKVLSDLSTPEIASKVRVIYGGSVNEKDAGDFLQDGGVDGVLAGKASLDPKKFVEIVKICEALGK